MRARKDDPVKTGTNCTCLTASNLDQPFTAHFFKQLEEIVLAPLRLDVVFVEQGISNSSDPPWFSKQVPDARPDRI